MTMPPPASPQEPAAPAAPLPVDATVADVEVPAASAATATAIVWGLEFKALLWLVLGTSALFLLILWPFSGAICWAVFLAISFWPIHVRFVEKLKGRNTWAAFLTLLLIILIVLLPLAFLISSVLVESSALAEKVRTDTTQLSTYFQQIVDLLPRWVRNLLHRFGVGDLAHVQQKLVAGLTASSQVLTARVFMIGQNTVDFIVSFFLMLYVLFFFLRDGQSLTAVLERSIPLRKRDTRKLLTQFAVVVRATVKGNVVMALVQGALGGLAFWVLDVPGAMLWGSVMALLSLLPAVGAALVWVPVAIYFVTIGSMWQAVALTLWGTLVIGLVDNILRPVLVGKDTRMPDYLVLLATLGGIAVFGLNGFVIGPVIAALFLVSWGMLARNRPDQELDQDTTYAAAPAQSNLPSEP